MENCKYFLEHKNLNTWLTHDGSLTSDPLNCLSYKDEWIAKNMLEQQNPDTHSDYSGMHATIDYTFVHIHNFFKEEVFKNTGFDLYKDFIVTEHLFL